jgi:hypothetical protein
MKYWVALASLIVVTTLAMGQQQPAAPAVSCTKNVSFSVAEAGQPVPAIPKFAAKWLDNKSHRQQFGSMCFSQIPTSTLSNYIVVFSTNEGSFQGLKPSAQTYTTANQPKDASDVASYGGTWSYAYAGVPPPPTTDTLDLKRDDKPKAVDVRAFDQTGRVVSRRTLAAAGSRDKLLEQVLGDIISDSPTTTGKKGFVAPMSVYYVNCNVPDQPPNPGMPETASATPPPPAAAATPNKPPPPPDPVLEIWSTPSGADVFLDGDFVGRTPYTATVTAGEHTINLRKKDYGIWQRKVTASSGKRRVGATLEQKVLVLQ